MRTLSYCGNIIEKEGDGLECEIGRKQGRGNTFSWRLEIKENLAGHPVQYGHVGSMHVTSAPEIWLP